MGNWTSSRVEIEASSSTDLPESIFFTARKARIRSNIQETSCSSEPASSSRKYYSTRIHSIMERRSELSMSREDAEIEASKDHWTVVEPDYLTAATRIGSDLTSSGSVSQSYSEAMTESERLSLYEENMKEMVRLQEANPESGFFRIGDDGLVLGRKIGEGGQAEIYDAGLFVESEKKYAMVLKVFKAGVSVSALQSQWPLALLHKNRCSYGNNGIKTNLYNPVLSGRLLDDGRFAFHMLRFWGDLRKWLDVRMEHNGNRHPPFMMPDGNYHECCMLYIIGSIARGMRDFHREGTLHRDLKASNVLVTSFQYPEGDMSILAPLELKHDIVCLVSDYECSIGVVGSGYWRAPEILEALKYRRVGTTPNLFTPKSDVYSFAMTCYEVLTGCIPFEEVGNCDGRTLVDDVLGGRRPTLPDHLQPWVVDLMNRCWHMDPCERPTFEELLDLLEGIIHEHLSCQSRTVFFEAHGLCMEHEFL